MKHGRADYNARIQDAAVKDPSLLVPGARVIAEDEPVFLLRASDKLAPYLVREYARALRQALPGGSEMWKQSDAVVDVAIAMEEWQHRYGAKLPDVPQPAEASSE